MNQRALYPLHDAVLRVLQQQRAERRHGLLANGDRCIHAAVEQVLQVRWTQILAQSIR